MPKVSNILPYYGCLITACLLERWGDKLARMSKSKWLANAIGQGVVGWGTIQLGGVAVGLVVSSFFAVFAYDSGLAWYWLILLSAAVLFFLVNTANSIASFVIRIRERKAIQEALVTPIRQLASPDKETLALRKEASELKQRLERLEQRPVGTFPAPLLTTSQSLDQTDIELELHRSWPSFGIGVHNTGPSVARGVEVWLERVSGPSYDLGEHLPHRLRTRDGKEKRCEINPDREELFEFATSSTSKQFVDVGIELQISGLRLDPNRNRNAPSEHMVMRLGEHVHLHITVHCANAKPQTAIFFAWPLHPTLGIGYEVERIY